MWDRTHHVLPNTKIHQALVRSEDVGIEGDSINTFFSQPSRQTNFSWPPKVGFVDKIIFDRHP